MSKLQHLHTSDQLRLNCYRTFIERSVLFHMTVIYHHLTDRDQKELARVTKTAGKLAKQTSKLPNEVLDHRIHNKAWRLATTVADVGPITFDTLPSGRYRAIKHRTALRRNCFRANAISILYKQ